MRPFTQGDEVASTDSARLDDAVQPACAKQSLHTLSHVLDLKAMIQLVARCTGLRDLNEDIANGDTIANAHIHLVHFFIEKVLAKSAGLEVLSRGWDLLCPHIVVGRAVVEKCLVGATMGLVGVLVADDTVLGDLHSASDWALVDGCFDAAVGESFPDLAASHMDDGERLERLRVAKCVWVRRRRWNPAGGRHDECNSCARS